MLFRSAKNDDFSDAENDAKNGVVVVKQDTSEFHIELMKTEELKSVDVDVEVPHVEDFQTDRDESFIEVGETQLSKSQIEVEIGSEQNPEITGGSETDSEDDFNMSEPERESLTVKQRSEEQKGLVGDDHHHDIGTGEASDTVEASQSAGNESTLPGSDATITGYEAIMSGNDASMSRHEQDLTSQDPILAELDQPLSRSEDILARQGTTLAGQEPTSAPVECELIAPVDDPTLTEQDQALAGLERLTGNETALTHSEPKSVVPDIKSDVNEPAFAGNESQLVGNHQDQAQDSFGSQSKPVSLDDVAFSESLEQKIEDAESEELDTDEVDQKINTSLSESSRVADQGLSNDEHLPEGENLDDPLDGTELLTEQKKFLNAKEEKGAQEAEVTKADEKNVAQRAHLDDAVHRSEATEEIEGIAEAQIIPNDAKGDRVAQTLKATDIAKDVQTNDGAKDAQIPQDDEGIKEVFIETNFQADADKHEERAFRGREDELQGKVKLVDTEDEVDHCPNFGQSKSKESRDEDLDKDAQLETGTDDQGQSEDDTPDAAVQQGIVVEGKINSEHSEDTDKHRLNRSSSCESEQEKEDLDSSNFVKNSTDDESLEEDQMKLASARTDATRDHQPGILDEVSKAADHLEQEVSKTEPDFEPGAKYFEPGSSEKGSQHDQDQIAIDVAAADETRVSGHLDAVEEMGQPYVYVGTDFLLTDEEEAERADDVRRDSSDALTSDQDDHFMKENKEVNPQSADMKDVRDVRKDSRDLPEEKDDRVDEFEGDLVSQNLEKDGTEVGREAFASADLPQKVKRDDSKSDSSDGSEHKKDLEREKLGFAESGCVSDDEKDATETVSNEKKKRSPESSSSDTEDYQAGGQSSDENDSVDGRPAAKLSNGSDDDQQAGLNSKLEEGDEEEVDFASKPDFAQDMDDHHEVVAIERSQSQSTTSERSDVDEVDGADVFETRAHLTAPDVTPLMSSELSDEQLLDQRKLQDSSNLQTDFDHKALENLDEVDNLELSQENANLAGQATMKTNDQFDEEMIDELAQEPIELVAYTQAKSKANEQPEEDMLEVSPFAKDTTVPYHTEGEANEHLEAGKDILEMSPDTEDLVGNIPSAKEHLEDTNEMAKLSQDAGDLTATTRPIFAGAKGTMLEHPGEESLEEVFDEEKTDKIETHFTERDVEDQDRFRRVSQGSRSSDSSENETDDERKGSEGEREIKESPFEKDRKKEKGATRSERATTGRLPKLYEYQVLSKEVSMTVIVC